MLPNSSMRLAHVVPLALIALLGAAPAPLAAQEDQPSKGKIDDVERSADNAKKKGSDDNDEGGGGWFIGGVGDAFSAFAELCWGVHPRQAGQGYLSYPYAAGSGETFVRRDVTDGRRFGAVSATYFADDESALRAGHFSVEWAGGILHREIEFSTYAEPMPDGTDHLQMLRLSFTLAPPIGDLGYVKVGGGFQIVTLGTGDAATGPEVELGVQLFPRRPFGLGAAARVAPLTWNGGPEWGVGFVDLAGNGSVFVGRVEVLAGYRWTRIGVGSPFHGPMVGMRVWF